MSDTPTDTPTDPPSDSHGDLPSDDDLNQEQLRQLRADAAREANLRQIVRSRMVEVCDDFVVIGMGLDGQPFTVFTTRSDDLKLTRMLALERLVRQAAEDIEHER